MANWLDRATRNFSQSGPQGAANADEIPILAATAAPRPDESQKIDPTEGEIIAVLIDSPIVGPVWFALFDDFKSGDDIPVFFMSEVPYLDKMEPAELRRRYEQKIALGGGWIRGRTDEPVRH